MLKLTPKHDLSYLLAAPPDWVFDDFVSFATLIYDKDTQEEKQHYAQERATNYMRVFHAAVEEGWDEFANAALAYFLFSQPIHFEKRLYVDWRDLGAALRLAPTLKGYHRVERALQVAGARICGDGQHHYDALCLAAWVPAGAPHVELPADFTGVTESPRKDIEKELIEDIGTETWLKLGTKAKQQLCDAERQWYRQHMDIGRGMKDWGGVALSFVKPIEGELGRKLDNVLGSAAFQNYHIRTYNQPPKRHIELGRMLYLFKEFGRLDQSLQSLIVDTNIRLQEDNDLIKRLLEAMKYRNKGAHRDGLSAVEFVKLRELLFEKGALKRFIELL